MELWTVRGLFAKYKKTSLAAAGVLAAMVVSLILAVALGSNAGAVTDTTTCAQWGSTTQNRQTAYAELYVREHGPVAQYGSAPAAVIDAINFGCGLAYGDDVSDTTTVVQAVNRTF